MGNEKPKTPLTKDEWVKIFEPREMDFAPKHGIDPWLVVCERCPLDDCVRPEGLPQPSMWGWGKINDTMKQCPIYQAHLLKLTPAQAVNGKADKLKLLDEGWWKDD